MTDQNYLAFDFGAQSARAILGKIKEGKLEIEEKYRFITGGTRVLDSLQWDVLRFFNEIKTACKIVSQEVGNELLGMGIDSWGVDYALLDKNGDLLANPYHYRDKRTNNIYEYTFQKIPKDEIYQKTGIQFMQINALFQLASMVRDHSPLLTVANHFLMIADFFHYLLTKRIASEYTLATTSQLYDLDEKNWSISLIERLGLKPTLFPEIIPSSTELGVLLPSIAREVRLKETKVIAPAAHDTAAAIAAVPAIDKNFIYISSGTWSLMGTELSEPLVSKEALVNNFTNEGGIFGTIRFLKNISGLWILSECKKLWDKVHSCTYKQLNEEVLQIKPFKSFIDPDNPLFLNPENMIEAIKQFCRATNQVIPDSRGELVRCILESLAMKYKHVYNRLTKILKKSFERLHIIGGGSQNQLLSQFAANSTGLEVKTGPIEATAIGNILTQAISQKGKKKFSDIRRIVINSFDIQTFSPEEVSEWDDAYQTFIKILND